MPAPCRAPCQAGPLPTAGGPHSRAVLHGNLAACRLRQRKWADAVESCDAACALSPTYTKALYRRAQAKRHLKQYQECAADAAAALAAAQRTAEVIIDDGAKKVVTEIRKFMAEVQKEYEKVSAEAERASREESGITLAQVEDDGAKGVYYHYASQGEKTQDFMWYVSRTLEQVLMECRHDNPKIGGVIYATRVGEDEIHGNATIRTHGGRRALFFDLDVTVEWRGVVGEGTDKEAALEGGTRMWNISHANKIEEWKHESRRKQHPTGPTQDLIAAQLAPAIAAKLKTGVQQVIGMLMYAKIDRNLLEKPGAKPEAAPKETQRKVRAPTPLHLHPRPLHPVHPHPLHPHPFTRTLCILTARAPPSPIPRGRSTTRNGTT